MQARHKVVELSGTRYQIRKLPPEVGSFIFMRMLGVSMRQSQEAAEQAPKPAVTVATSTEIVEAPKLTGEMRVRALAFAVFSGGVISFENFKFIQNACLQSAALLDTRDGVEFPMPVMTDTGIYTKEGEELADNVGMVMRLTTEVLIFCFADFFADGGAGL